MKSANNWVVLFLAHVLDTSFQIWTFLPNLVFISIFEIYFKIILHKNGQPLITIISFYPKEPHETIKYFAINLFQSCVHLTYNFYFTQILHIWSCFIVPIHWISYSWITQRFHYMSFELSFLSFFEGVSYVLLYSFVFFFKFLICFFSKERPRYRLIPQFLAEKFLHTQIWRQIPLIRG